MNAEENLKNRFSHHLVNDNQNKKMELLRKRFLELAIEIDISTKNSREKSLAITKLEESMFWINSSIAREE